MVYKLIDEEDGETIFGKLYKWELQGVADDAVQVPEKMAEGCAKLPSKGPMDKYAIKMGRLKMEFPKN